jgi:hypothetical protein
LWAALTLAIVSLGSLSDRLLIIQFLAPLCLALGYAAARRFVSWRVAAKVVLLLVAGVLLGQVLERGLQLRGVVFGAAEVKPQFPSLDTIGRLVGRFFTADLWSWLRPVPLLAVMFGGQCLVALVVAARLSGVLTQRINRDETLDVSRREVPRLLLVLTVLLCPVCNVTAILLGAATTGLMVLDRYFLPCAVLPFLTLGLVPFAIRPDRRVLAGVFVGVCAAGITIGVARQASGCRGRFLHQPYPELVQAVDCLVGDRPGHEQGFAGYWTARHLNYLSRAGVRLAPALADGDPFLLGNHPDIYLPASGSARPHFALIVFQPGEDHSPTPKQIAAEYGPPVEKHTCGTAEIWLYSAMRNRKLDQFIDSIGAERIRRRSRVIAPSSPRALAHPMPNCSLPSVFPRRGMRLGKGETVEVQFAQPVHGDFIDISAYCFDRCVLTFYAGDVVLAQLRVPRVLWTGLGYGDPGLQTRLLPVPAELADRSWTRVVIAPADPADSVSLRLGHFLVLQTPQPSAAPGR